MATSNFKSLGSLPLYVFHTEGEVYERAEEEVKKLNIRDFDTYEDFEDAREEEIEKVRDELDSTGVVLTDFDIGELEMEVEELNDDIKSLIDNDYSYDYTDEEVNLEDIATFDISYGYYEGGQITNKHPEVFDDLNEEHQEFILDHLKEIAEKFDLTELHTDARFDNGETMYSVKKKGKESKKEDETMNESSEKNNKLTETKRSYSELVCFLLADELNMNPDDFDGTTKKTSKDKSYYEVTDSSNDKYIVMKDDDDTKVSFLADYLFNGKKYIPISAFPDDVVKTAIFNNKLLYGPITAMNLVHAIEPILRKEWLALLNEKIDSEEHNFADKFTYMCWDYNVSKRFFDTDSNGKLTVKNNFDEAELELIDKKFRDDNYTPGSTRYEYYDKYAVRFALEDRLNTNEIIELVKNTDDIDIKKEDIYSLVYSGGVDIDKLLSYFIGKQYLLDRDFEAWKVEKSNKNENVEMKSRKTNRTTNVNEDISGTESDTEMKKEYIDALSKKLDIPSESMKANVERDAIGDRYCIVTVEDDGRRYIVADYEIAEELAKEYVKEEFEENGLDAFSPNFAKYICNNFYDRDFVESKVKEDIDNYVEYSHDYKTSNERFESLFEEECYNRNVLDKEDFEEDEDGTWILKDKSDANIDELEYQLEDVIFSNISEHYEYLCNTIGEEAVRDLLVENNAFDEEAIAKETVNTYGIALFLASYDGDELDLGDGLFAYRID